MPSVADSRQGLRLAGRAIARLFLLGIVLPMLAFVAVGSIAPEFYLERYEYDAQKGYVPVPLPPEGGSHAGVIQLAGFYTRFLVGVVAGTPGRSRDAADRPVTSLLFKRALPSLTILVIAMGLCLLSTGLGAVAVLRASGRKTRWRAWLERAGGPLASIFEGLPLPFVGMMAFVLVVRLVPRDGALESDTAMLLWAGVCLALGDAVLSAMVRAGRQETRRALGRPYVLAARLRGETPLAALTPNLLPVLAAHGRGAMLLFIGGLVVVEPALGINGLGETFKDIVTDRAGTDVLLFAAVLLMFAIPVALLDLTAVLTHGAGTEGS